MKRILFLALSAILLNVCVAQNAKTVGSKSPQDIMKMTKKAPVSVFTGNETRAGNSLKLSGEHHPKPVAATETVIGTTTYDLQTNTAIARRLFNHGSGNLSATWTFSTDLGGSWPDRGTGYNYYNGTSWGAAPTVRVETVRTGWPEVISTSTGYEVIICHDPANGNLVKNDRSTIGSGAWTEVNLTAISPTNLWPRMAVGGSNGQSIHVVGLTTPVGNGGNLYNGLDGALLYSRSQDGGVTWDVLAIQLPGADTSNFSGFGGDSYCIDARGDVVAIIASGLGDGIALWKSTDNGSTWTMSWPAKPQIPKFAEDVHNTDIILNGDSMYSSDGTSAVLIDNNDVVHAFWGRQYIINDDITDGLLSYFPITNAIDYWNENMGENNHDSIAGGYMNNFVGWASYRFNGQAGYPHAGIDANNCIYLTYSAVTDHDDGTFNYRHIYGVKSCDGGCSWMAAKDVIRDPNGSHAYDECVYASIARTVNSDMHFIWQRDVTPSVNLIDNNHPIVVNDIIYTTQPNSYLDTTYAVCITYIKGDTVFCLGDSTMLTASCGNAWNWSTGATTQSIYATNYQTYTVTITTNCGSETESITTSGPAAPVASITGTNQICTGDSTQLTASSVVGGTYSWSTSETTQSIWATSTGTYTVTVTNCSGSDTASITVSTVPLPVATISPGDTAFCHGSGPVTFTGGGGSSYLWSNTFTTPTIALNDSTESGTYYVIAYNICGDADTSASINVTIYPLPPVPTITYDGTTFTCNETGYSYQWYVNSASQSGETNQTYTPDAVWVSGKNVTVVITDTNGCSRSSSPVINVNDISNKVGLTLYPNPNEGQFNISFRNAVDDNYTLILTNILGEEVFSSHVHLQGNKIMPFDVSDISKGIYFLSVRNSTSEITKKLTIK